MKNLTPILLLLLLVSISSCKKEEESPTLTNNNLSEKAKLLIAKPWKIASATENGNDVSIKVACIKDNLFIYSIDGSYKVDEGATKCISTDPQTIFDLSWGFIDNETKIMFSDSTIANITELTSTKYVLLFPPQLVITYTNQ